ncbi:MULTISPECIES: dihydropteroate synthase [Chlamydia]|uniref:2-amino-4-hydroxy-6-hydroxymethyldihydropteridine diphosphokinase n=2 Tax=Chlamydia TaxID=810 RepID=A0ABP2X406_CHLPS|nr:MULTISPECIES: dihydropteroate synthase [Chlamydia]AFS20091.1 2-amino-4-hydroxy-6-hydroxymethyldihydropteridine pyrophosphokinase [Chlamydia psittaci 84/55]AFS23276.1 2-amino-4-hydroxy-6-hydroxymethyldihydropteridine pyrophosphokinase [Chlamydia psittaci VS225]EPJ15807.1 2-amino-4-hydroxy-6-hydroxymethyldihydropteridine diphosphokinase [Chlamydia psittaci 02DC18]EPJ17415.1 2-amino-4-hydroxy-6-hydroxymethyldihydropteridine diphosphokinase [Chlamydia psittaci 02DC22]EPJ19666.1 2-amino-4-hydrox
MITKHFICLSLGSNLGNRFENFRRAFSLLKELGIEDLQSSIILETKALLLPDSPKEWDLPFFNSVLIGRTALSPKELLSGIKHIERKLGRDPNALPWSPRILDVDILLYGDENYQQDDIIIPHHRILERPFLLSLVASLCPTRKLHQPDSEFHLKTFGEIAHCLPCPQEIILNSFSPTTFLMGIVNVTDNSISDGGLYIDPSKAVAHAERLFAQGASVIDFGAQATNPKIKQLIDVDQEWARLEPVLKLLAEKWSGCMQYPDVSLDTFYPEIIKRALEIYPIRWINDVSGGSKEMAEIARDANLLLVINHSCSLPPRPDKTLAFTTCASDQLLSWGKQQIEAFVALGLSKDQIIFDPGIGFGTTPIQALNVLHRMEKFRELGCATLVGHSRKSCFSLLGKYDAKDRDWETVSLSVLLQQQGVNYLRVHDVEANHRVLSAAAWPGVYV